MAINLRIGIVRAQSFAGGPHGDEAGKGAEESEEAGRQVLVEARDGDERRARSRQGRLQAAKRSRDRLFAEAQRGTEQPSKEHSFPLGDVDAGLLCESRRKKP